MASRAEQAAISPVSPSRMPPKLPPPSTSPHGGDRLPILSDPAGSTSSAKQRALPIFSAFLMNDIPRGTSRGKLARFLLAQSSSPTGPLQQQPQVVFGSAISDSRLDDELSVATLEFSDTPPWLLNQDPSGFPKHTLLGTIWRGVDRYATDANGQSEFIRAVINSHRRLGLQYAEMLAEFTDTDVNIRDEHGRTALHWACAESLPDMVRLCLSVPDCQTGLRDNDGLTAFDIALGTGNESLTSLFYSSMFEIEQSSPQVALLRVLTLTSDETRSAGKPLFPGEALFQPVCERNSPLVLALLERGVVLTTKDEDGNTALHIAAGQVDKVDIVTRLLEAGSNINAIGNRGSTPLHSAVRTADTEMVQVLLHWKADVAITDEENMSALHLAAENGQLDIARVLLQGGADVRARDRLGRTAVEVAEANREVRIVEFLNTRDKLEQRVLPDPSDLPRDVPVVQSSPLKLQLKNPGNSTSLIQAAQDGDLAGVRAFLAQGEDIAAVDQYFNSALHQAAQGGHMEIIECLLAHGANTETLTPYGLTALLIAVRFRHTTSVKALLAGGAKIEAKVGDGDRSLHLAVQSGKTETVKALLAAGAEIEAAGYRFHTPLHWAVRVGEVGILKELLAAGALTESNAVNRETPLHHAVRWGRTEIVQILLSAGAEIEAEAHDGDRPLHLAVQDGNTETVKTLLAAGAEMEAAGYRGYTPLHWAVRVGDVGILNELLAAGARMEAKDEEGETPLHHAVICWRTEIVQILLSAGAEIEAEAHDGDRPLHLAVQDGNTETVKALLAAGAEMEAAGYRGDTPLHRVVRVGQVGILKELLSAGAEIESRTIDGKTAYQLASENNNKHLVKILGAQSSTLDRLRSNINYRYRVRGDN